MSESATYRSWSPALPAFEAPLDARLAFVRRTYLHVAGAAFAFVALAWLVYQTDLAPRIAQLAFGSIVGVLLWCLGFTIIGAVAQSMARSHRSAAVQYAGLGLTVALYAVILSPLLWFAARYFPNLLAPAAGLTIVTFAGLSGFVLATKKDLTFLGPILMVASLVLLGVIVLGAIFGFSGGLWLTGVLLVFTAGMILYQTSNVLHQYRTDEHVGAALALFATLAMLFQQILILLIQLQGGRSRS